MLTKAEVEKLVIKRQQTANLNTLANLISERIVSVIHGEIDNQIKHAISLGTQQLVVKSSHFQTLVSYRTLITREINEMRSIEDAKTQDDSSKTNQFYDLIQNRKLAMANSMESQTLLDDILIDSNFILKDALIRIFGNDTDNEFPNIETINLALEYYNRSSQLNSTIVGNDDKTLTISW